MQVLLSSSSFLPSVLLAFLNPCLLPSLPPRCSMDVKGLGAGSPHRNCAVAGTSSRAQIDYRARRESTCTTRMLRVRGALLMPRTGAAHRYLCVLYSVASRERPSVYPPIKVYCTSLSIILHFRFSCGPSFLSRKMHCGNCCLVRITCCLV